jgi:hypothetical protein
MSRSSSSVSLPSLAGGSPMVASGKKLDATAEFYSFSGMHHIFQCSEQPITVVRFAHESREFLAFRYFFSLIRAFNAPLQGLCSSAFLPYLA